MLRMSSVNAALVALVLSALFVIVVAVVLGMVVLSGPGRAHESTHAPGSNVVADTGEASGESVEAAGGRESWEVAGAGEEPVRAWDLEKEAAIAGLEELRAEIHVLKALNLLQTRLLGWNEVLIQSGVGPSSLEPRLCEEAELQVWCVLLPATFGRVEGDEDERD